MKEDSYVATSLWSVFVYLTVLYFIGSVDYHLNYLKTLCLFVERRKLLQNQKSKNKKNIYNNYYYYEILSP